MLLQTRPVFRVLALSQRRFQSTAPTARIIYEGGLSKAAKVMKLASVASLVGASAAIPFFFLGDSDVPQAARTILAATTLGMTGSSTAIVAWALKPYVTAIRTLDDAIGPQTPLLVDTMTLLAQRRRRLVFPEQLAPATLPLTSWMVREPSDELAAKAQEILSLVNGRTGKVAVARAGDVFYAHTQGELGTEMQQIIAASPCQHTQKAD
ncbi:mitochondrial proton-transporting ATP synthase complex assembly [Coemansia sp. RSA 2711]|nr:mitochondrial proton-transporting ATP synthase complex assembly [Coemansia sp. RSA 2711]KAJ2318904.1 mitochondrial proton-transporting ATP synthase complex assembly [Coemansia sp. RSA 2704]